MRFFSCHKDQPKNQVPRSKSMLSSSLTDGQTDNNKTANVQIHKQLLRQLPCLRERERELCLIKCKCHQTTQTTYLTCMIRLCDALIGVLYIDMNF